MNAPVKPTLLTWLERNTMTISLTDRHSRHRRYLTVASPILILVIGRLAAVFFAAHIGRWAWVGSSLVYWGSMAATIYLLGDMGQVRQWFSKPQGSRWWAVPAIGMGLIAFPLLLIPNLHVLRGGPLTLAWVAFGAVNAICEEAYWRGFLLDGTAHLPRAVGVIQSTALFTVIHPLMLGVFSEIQRFDPSHPFELLPFLVIVVMIGLVYSLIYLKTRSLRLAILSHVLSDLGNLSIFLFMNVVTMG